APTSPAALASRVTSSASAMSAATKRACPPTSSMARTVVAPRSELGALFRVGTDGAVQDLAGGGGGKFLARREDFGRLEGAEALSCEGSQVVHRQVACVASGHDHGRDALAPLGIGDAHDRGGTDA